MADCFDSIRKLWPKEDVPDEVVVRMIDDISKIKDILQKSGSMENFTSQTKAYLEDLQALTSGHALARAENIVKAGDLKIRLEKFQNKTEGIMSALSGSNVNVPGAREAADIKARRQKSTLGEMHEGGLKRDGLKQIALDGKLDAEIAEARISLAQGKQPSIPITEEAWKIAKIQHSVDMEIQADSRLSGNHRSKMGQFPQVHHDPVQVRVAGFEKWMEFISSRLDNVKTFGSENPDVNLKLMESIYNEITDGEYGRNIPPQGEGDLQSMFKSADLADKLARNRELYFKDGKSFAEYNKEFGAGTLYQAMHKSIDRSSKQNALVSIFGTNPEATIENLIKQNKINPTEANKIRDTYQSVLGFNSIPGMNLLAKTGASARALQMLSKLGSVFFSSWGDWATSAAMLRSNFHTNFLEGMGKLAKNYMELAPKGQKDLWAKRLGVFLEDQAGMIHMNNVEGVDIPGSIVKMKRLFANATGLEWHTQTGTMATAKQVAMDLADASTSGWKDLHPRTRSQLETYGVTEPEWKIFQNGIEDIQGAKAMTPEGVKALPDSVFKEALAQWDKPGRPPALADYKRLVANKLRDYITDASFTGVPQPNARVRARVIGDPDPNTPSGQLQLMWAQFKQFPFMMHEIAMRTAMSDPAKPTQNAFDAIFKGQGDASGLAQLMIASTAIGFLGYKTQKNIREGIFDYTPSFEELPKYMMKGGGMGYYADFLLDEHKHSFSRPAMTGIVKRVAGPVPAEAYDLGNLFFDIKKDLSEKGEVSPRVKLGAVDALQRNTPFGNVFWSKWALDRYLFDRFRSAADPNWEERKANAKALKENGGQ